MGRILTKRLTRFNGGISTNDKGTDIPGSGTWMRGCETNSVTLKGNILNSAITETDTIVHLPYAFTSIGNIYYMIVRGTSSQEPLYKYTSSAWTTVGNAFNGTFNDIAYYKNYIYFTWGGTGAIGKYGDITGTPSMTNSDHALTNADFMANVGVNLYIAGDATITSYNGTTYTDGALTLPTGTAIQKMTSLRNNLAIIADVGGKGKLFTWDTTSSTWNTELDLPSTATTMVNYREGLMLFFDDGSISWTNGTSITYLRDFEMGYSGNPHINASYKTHATAWKNKVYIGVESATSEFENGIYSVEIRGDKVIFSCEYTTSPYAVSDTIGGIYHGSDQNMMFGVKDDSASNHITYLVGANSGYSDYKYRSPSITFGTNKKKFIKSIEIISKPLASGAVGYEVLYEIDDAGGKDVTSETNWTSLGTVSTTNQTYQYYNIGKEARRLRVQITGNFGGSNTAEITEIIITAEELDYLH